MEKKIAIVLHIYYTEMWEYYENKLQSLTTEFDLYITLCEEVEDISNDILRSFPTANIKKYKNKGQDIGSFLLTLKDIRHKDYDYLIKLHTKGVSGLVRKKRNKEFFERWRNELVNSLIGTDKKIEKNIFFLEESQYKMCGCKKWHKRHKNKEWKFYGNKKKQNFEFIGGTMFMVDFKFFKEIYTDEIIDEYYSKTTTEYKSNYTFNHYLERQLGQCILDAGFKIKGV